MCLVSALQLGVPGGGAAPMPVNCTDWGEIRGIVADDEGRSTLAGT